MAIRYAVCDWNGTLFDPATDEELNKSIAYAVRDDAAAAVKRGKVWRAWDLVKLLKAKKRIQRRLDEYKAGERPLADVYEPFNELVIAGTPGYVILGTMNRYVAEHRHLTDDRMMQPLWEFAKTNGRNGILSTSQEHVIKMILKRHAGLFDSGDIVANTLECDEQGIAKRMTLDIYGRKGEVFEDEFLRERGFDPQATVYAGDTKDDLPVADLLPRGRFVVPFSATGEFREMAAGMYGAFAPESQQDLQAFLLKS